MKKLKSTILSILVILLMEDNNNHVDDWNVGYKK